MNYAPGPRFKIILTFLSKLSAYTKYFSTLYLIILSGDIQSSVLSGTILFPAVQ